MRFSSSVTFLVKLIACLVAFYSAHVAVDAQAAAATSYSPFFQNLFAQASAPVAALPRFGDFIFELSKYVIFIGPGAQAPAIPLPGAPAFGPPPGR
ncbi:hypothetical protein M3Y97_00051600 [Aphelenchoides bicaudatus]|nr:hypothetical protein M3Y97_00051600 [Aphelenchoides bicaudatus]